MARRVARELHNINYEMFILAISILSIINLVLEFFWHNVPAAGVWRMIDAWLTIFFLFDFGLRLFSAESKAAYFFKGFGWADLLGSLWWPGLRLLRIFRIVRVTLLLRAYGGRKMLRTYRRERANGIFGTVILSIILVLEFGGMAVLHFENASPLGNIKNAGDALWWGIVTIATVGYGDYYPVTPGGRFVGVLTIVTGVVLFGTVTGFVANTFLGRRPRKAEDAAGTSSLQVDAAGPNDASVDLATDWDSQAILAEIQRLSAAEHENYASLEARLARIETLLAKVVAHSQLTS